MENTQTNQPVAQATSAGHGGARAGAGRKKLSADERKVTLSIQILPATKARYLELRKNGIDVNERIEAEIARLAKAFGIE